MSSNSKPAESESNHESSSSETPESDCSSPDSLKTEMIFFKPIIREPKTPSSSTKPVLLRIPSIRSTASSTDRYISSPCPSPFFIPITPRRESAFTVVGCSDDVADTQPIVKPMPTKRRYVKTSPKKIEKSPKRIKREPAGRKKEVTKTENVISCKTRSMGKKNETKTQPKAAAPAKKEVKKSQAEPVKRVTRSQSLKH